MIKYLLPLLLIALIIVPNVGAEDDNQTIEQKYSITFPITELGNCASVSECKAYCDQDTNKASCSNFAKTHSLYQKNPVAEAAKTELGCDYASTCKQFCSQPSNILKCKDFFEKFIKTKNQIKDSAESLKTNVASLSGGLASQLALLKKFCAQNTSSCLQIIQQSTSDSSNNYSELAGVCLKSGCKWTGNICYCRPSPSNTDASKSATVSPSPTKTYPITPPVRIALPQTTASGSSLLPSAIRGISIGPNWLNWFWHWFTRS